MDRRTKIIFAVIGTLACWPIFLGIALAVEWFSYSSDIKAHEAELAEFKRTDDSTYQVNFKNACDSFATFKLLEVRKVLEIHTFPTLCQRVLKVRKTDKLICRHNHKYDYANVCEPLMDTTWTSYQCGTHQDTVWSEGMYNEAARNRGIRSWAEGAADKARGTPPEYSGKSRHWLLRAIGSLMLFSMNGEYHPIVYFLNYLLYMVILVYLAATPYVFFYLRRVYNERRICYDRGYVTVKDCFNWLDKRN